MQTKTCIRQLLPTVVVLMVAVLLKPVISSGSVSKSTNINNDVKFISTRYQQEHTYSKRNRRRLGHAVSASSAATSDGNCLFTCRLRRPEILYESSTASEYEEEDTNDIAALVAPVCIIDDSSSTENSVVQTKQRSYYTIHTTTTSNVNEQKIWIPSLHSDNSRFIETGAAKLCVANNPAVKDVLVHTKTKQIVIVFHPNEDETSTANLVADEMDDSMRVFVEQTSTHNNDRELQQQEQQHFATPYISSTTGLKTILAVRVVFVAESDDATEDVVVLTEPDESIQDIYAAIFGGNNTADDGSAVISVVQQYKDLSHNQLQFTPASTSSMQQQGRQVSSVNMDGVVEVNVPLPTKMVTSNNRNDDILSRLSNLDIELELVPLIQSATTQQILQQDQSDSDGLELHDLYDRVIYCIPTGSHFQNSTKWTAFTYLNEPYSYYQHSRCTKLSVVAHELGHSFGFHHSGVANENAYSDKTDYMGYAQNIFGSPRKAFNGHKHWISGWYDDDDDSVDSDANNSKITLDFADVQQQQQHIKLLSYVDYDRNDYNDNTVVLIRLDSTMYLQYNRAKGYATDVDEPDTVTITQAYELNGQSTRLAALNSTDPIFTYTKHDERVSISILLCNIEKYSSSDGFVKDVATLTIFENDVKNNEFDHQQRCQTLAPTTLAPTSSPAPVALSPSISPSTSLVRNIVPALAISETSSSESSQEQFGNISSDEESGLPVKTVLLVTVSFVVGFFALLTVCVHVSWKSSAPTLVPTDDDFNKCAATDKSKTTSKTRRTKRRQRRRGRTSEEDVSETEADDGLEFDSQYDNSKLRLHDDDDSRNIENASTSSSLCNYAEYD